MSRQTGKLTSAAIDARDYLRARKDRETMRASCHEGTLVAFTGGKDFGEPVSRHLSAPSTRHQDQVRRYGPRCTAADLASEKIAAKLGRPKNGVHQVVCQPNSITSRDDRSALEMSEVR